MSFPTSGDGQLLFEEQLNTANVPSDLPASLAPSGSSLAMVSSSWLRFTTPYAGNYASSAWMSVIASMSPVRDVEAFAYFRFPTSREAAGRLVLRASYNTIDCYSGYYLDINPNGYLQIGRGDGQWLTGSSPIGSLGQNTVYCARFRAYGNTLYSKIWPQGSTEPGWQQQVNDTMYSSAGYVGVCVLPGQAQQVTYFDLGWLDYFAVGTVLPAKPVVNAGGPASAQIGSVYTRQGSVSVTGAVSWSWAMTSKPAGSSATLTGGAPTVSFTPDVVGKYVLTATVTDSYGQTGTDNFTFTAVAKSTLGGRIVMLDDGQLHAARHRAYLAAGHWSS